MLIMRKEHKYHEYGQVLNCIDPWIATACNDGSTECCTTLYTDTNCCASHGGKKINLTSLLYITIGIGAIGLFIMKRKS